MPCFHEGGLLRLLHIDNHTTVIGETVFTQNQLTIVGSKQRKISIDIFFGKQVLQCRTEAIFGMYKILTLLKELCNVY